ncbi:MAG: sensor histidine kinase [Acidimicrobiales bacterium]
MKLYQKLTITMVVLLVLALGVADLVTYTSLRSFLYGRLDSQLASSQHLVARYLDFSALHGRRVTEEGIDNRVDPDIYVLVVGKSGRVLLSRPSGLPNQPDPAPVLPRQLRVASVDSGRNVRRDSGVYHPDPNAFTVSGPSHSGFEYRAQAMLVPQGTLVSALSLNSTNDTLSSLLRVEGVVSAAVLLALCILALWTIRRGLRPLDAMARTAGDIASGDFGRRVEVKKPGTEVGRLGEALNTMMVRIEGAFSEKSASEARLRQFVADASHELRTPLTSIRGYAELLGKGGFPDRGEQRRALDRIEGEATRMGGLVDDLLLLARLDQGRPLVREPVDLSRIAQDAVDDALASGESGRVHVHARVPVIVAGDRDRLVQVAHNVVRNALTHTPPGTPVVVSVTTSGPMGVLEVRDEGEGMTPDEAARVFDRFYRGDTSRSGQGTGLGLAIVRAIAEALGGGARVESYEGRGSTFVVTVPLIGEPVPDGPRRSLGRDRPALSPGEVSIR